MVEDWGEAYHPNEEPAVPKFLLSSLYNAMFYSAVVLFLLLKKNARPQGRRIMGRESGVFIRRSVCILLYDLKLSKKKKKKIQSLTFTVAAVFIQTVSKPGLPALLPRQLPSHWTTRGHRQRRMHTHKHTNTHARTHTNTQQTNFPHLELNSGVAQLHTPSEHACPPISTCGAKETCRK